MGDLNYEICAPSVVGEVIDGEAIIMDLRTGAYYSADGVGAVIWEAIERGVGRNQIIEWAGSSFPGTPQARPEAEAFLADLVSRDLVRAAQGHDLVADMPAAQTGYQTPRLAIYEDMKELIVLDPIHDVDEVGWPKRKSEAE